MYRARIVVETEHADAVLGALLPEMGEGRRFTAYIRSENPLTIEIEARDVTALRAAVNSYLRLLILLGDLEEGL